MSLSGGTIYAPVFLYLQVLDFLTSLIGFKLGLHDASLLIRVLWHYGPVLALAASKLTALALAGACIALHHTRVIRWINYWYAGLIAWNLLNIFAACHPAR